MQEESLIRMNPPCASTDLVRGPTTTPKIAGGRGWWVRPAQGLEKPRGSRAGLPRLCGSRL